MGFSVQVKQLEWVEGDGTDGSRGYWEANALGLTYCVCEHQWWILGSPGTAYECDNDEAAKASAQADLDDKVMGMLIAFEKMPRAWLVENLMIPRQPVKAKGAFPEPSRHLYLEERGGDARQMAKMLRADLKPLYEIDPDFLARLRVGPNPKEIIEDLAIIVNCLKVRIGRARQMRSEVLDLGKRGKFSAAYCWKMYTRALTAGMTHEKAIATIKLHHQLEHMTILE